MILKRPVITIDRNPEAESFVAIATYIPIARWRDVPKAARLSSRVEAQIKETPGAVAYSLAVDPLRRRFWTCSVWKDRASAQAFARNGAHAAATARYSLWAGPGAAFVDWESASSRPDWTEAMERLKRPDHHGPASA